MHIKLDRTRNEDQPLSFSLLFSTHYENLHHYAYTILKDQEAANDIVQQAFTVLWEKQEVLTMAQAIPGYLYTTTRNLSLNYIRHKKAGDRYMRHAVKDADNYILNDAKSWGVTSELTRQISEVMETLPEQCKSVFAKSRMDKKTYAQISAELGISVKTVEAHMGKALKIFRAKLTDYLDFLDNH
jgi:RNA polymerase sigma-70 factor, ECF subfamily